MLVGKSTTDSHLNQAHETHHDLGGINDHPPFHWLKTVISYWHFLAVFRVPNFRGRFEAINDIFLGIICARRDSSSIILLFQYCTPRRYLSNSLSSDLNRDRMQNVCPQEVGLPIYHFVVKKNYSRFIFQGCFRVFSSMLYLKRLFNLIVNSLVNERSQHIFSQR